LAQVGATSRTTQENLLPKSSSSFIRSYMMAFKALMALATLFPCLVTCWWPFHSGSNPAAEEKLATSSSPSVQSTPTAPASPQLAATKSWEPPPQFENLKGTPLPLVMLDEAKALKRGAVCLDGSAPGVYFRPAKDASASTKWVLFIKGGGWCVHPKACADRYRTSVGSSKHFPHQFPPEDQTGKAFSFNGYMDNDPLENPTFHNFNRVILWYCDGGLFASDREDPVSVEDPDDPSKNVSLFFRGRRVLDFMLEELQGPKFGMDKATEILFGGCSAGGLATYLLADYVAERLPTSVTKFRAAPVSGMMTAHLNATGGLGFIENMRLLAEMHNATGAPGCVANMPRDEQWKCVLANYSYAYSRTPFFLMQSVLDGQNVMQWGDRKVQTCAATDYEQCTSEDMRAIKTLYHDFMVDLRKTPKYFSAGEGGFVETCGLHMGQLGVGFNNWKVLDTTPNKALTLWWNRNSSFHNQWYLPCPLGDEPPYQCNPSCRPPRQAPQATALRAVSRHELD